MLAILAVQSRRCSAAAPVDKAEKIGCATTYHCSTTTKRYCNKTDELWSYGLAEITRAFTIFVVMSTTQRVICLNFILKSIQYIWKLVKICFNFSPRTSKQDCQPTQSKAAEKTILTAKQRQGTLSFVSNGRIA